MDNLTHLSLFSGIGNHREILGGVPRNLYINSGNLRKRGDKQMTKQCYAGKGTDCTVLKEMVSAMPTIDLIHAVGACYCRECKYRFTDNCSTYYKSSQGKFQHIIEDDGFCSYAEKMEAPC